MTAPTPEDSYPVHPAEEIKSNASSAMTVVIYQRDQARCRVEELEAWRQVARENNEDLRNALAGATAARDDARRELAEQKRINASNLRVMTGQLELARQMLADAPHSYYCGTVIGNACRCWKAGL